MQNAKRLTSPAHEDGGGNPDSASCQGLFVSDCSLCPSQSHWSLLCAPQLRPWSSDNQKSGYSLFKIYVNQSVYLYSTME